jgi:AraC-like DNA-binding protein
MGKTFTNYLNYIRITEAEKLLLTTDKSMTEIALEVGFSSSSYFIQQFRQYKDISPFQFRKKGKA